MVEVDVNNIIELVEIGMVAIGLIGLATIKVISFLEKRKINKAKLEILRNQSLYNNNIPLKSELDSSELNIYPLRGN